MYTWYSSTKVNPSALKERALPPAPDHRLGDSGSSDCYDRVTAVAIIPCIRILVLEYYCSSIHIQIHICNSSIINNERMNEGDSAGVNEAITPKQL